MTRDHFDDDEAEDYYIGDLRKERKEHRKLKTAKDRSQYKKSDLDKAQPSSTVSLKGLFRGRVIEALPQGVVVQRDEDSQRFVCGLRGLLKKEQTKAKNLVVIGDYVWFDAVHGTEGVIASIEPRHTVLSRADNLSRRKEQFIAVNIDQVLITLSVVNPALKPAIVDRYIIATRKGGMQPVVVVNKIDLLIHEPEQQDLFDEFQRCYSAVGIPVIGVSAVNGEGMAELQELMKNHSSVFAGQSGVGKSSLINAVTGQNLPVGETVARTGKGSHTTSHARLLPLPFGGWCVDTPGIKSFGIWDLDRAEIQSYFPDIFEIGRQCRFADCSHTGEEGCAVIQAVNEGTLSPLRFDSYCGLIVSTSEKHERR